MSSLNTETVDYFEIGEEVVCPLIINGKIIKDGDFNVPTLGIIQSINGKNIKVNIFQSTHTLDANQLEKKLININGEDFYINMVNRAKKYAKTFDYKFSYGPEAANLYFFHNEIDYCLTFDYRYQMLYFRGLLNILEVDLNNICIENLSQLNDNLKILFKNMVKEMIFRTQGFTFSNVYNQILILKNLSETHY